MILNIAAGKTQPLFDVIKHKHYIVNVDLEYFNSETPEFIENYAKQIESQNVPLVRNTNVYCNYDIFKFMERTILYFENVCIYRFLEHVSFTQIPYFIYLVSTITKEDSIVDVIVPNYETLAKMILAEDIGAESLSNFEADNILLTTELLNEPSCPHASIWTPQRAKYFWELEGRFKVVNLDPQFTLDGRNIYIRIIARRL